MTLADKIREFVKINYIDQARKNGEQLVSVRASDIHKSMGLERRYPAICSAMDSDKFVDYASVVLHKRFGPPQSSSVVWTFDLMPNKRFSFQKNRESEIIKEIEPSSVDVASKTSKSPSDSLQQLVNIGFEEVGHWFLEADQVTFALNKSAKEANILYSFVVDGEVKYIGKSVQTLHKRMYLYKQGGDSQKTNIRNKADINACLVKGQQVKIYVLVPDLQMEYKGMPINIAAGLEDNIILKLKPEWNKR